VLGRSELIAEWRVWSCAGTPALLALCAHGELLIALDGYGVRFAKMGKEWHADFDASLLLARMSAVVHDRNTSFPTYAGTTPSASSSCHALLETFKLL
jgi:hypothetical protein